MRLRVFKKVDLPQPEGPMSAVISRSPTSSEMPFSALKSPYQRFRSFADITGMFVFSIEYLIVEFKTPSVAACAAPAPSVREPFVLPQSFIFPISLPP